MSAIERSFYRPTTSMCSKYPRYLCRLPFARLYCASAFHMRSLPVQIQSYRLCKPLSILLCLAPSFHETLNRFEFTIYPLIGYTLLWLTCRLSFIHLYIVCVLTRWRCMTAILVATGKHLAFFSSRLQIHMRSHLCQERHARLEHYVHPEASTVHSTGTRLKERVFVDETIIPYRRPTSRVITPSV